MAVAWAWVSLPSFTIWFSTSSRAACLSCCNVVTETCRRFARSCRYCSQLGFVALVFALLADELLLAEASNGPAKNAPKAMAATRKMAPPPIKSIFFIVVLSFLSAFFCLYQRISVRPRRGRADFQLLCHLAVTLSS